MPQQNRRVRKAVFPVAGLGTRFLPATKTVPKEMLPVVDRPLIQYAVDEAIEAGCDTLVFVTNRYKHAVADYFDKAYELEQKLERAGKQEQLELVRNVLPEGVRAVFVTQPEARGLGHAVLCAEHVIDEEPFAVLLADDLIDARVPVMRQMADVAAREEASVIGVMTILPEETGKYGVVEAGTLSGGFAPVERIVEKPRPGTTASRLGVVGRYVLSPRIFHHLRAMPADAGGEIQLTDGIARLVDEEKVLAYAFDGRRYDCGSKLGYLEAMVDYGLKHPETGAGLARYLRERGLEGTRR